MVVAVPLPVTATPCLARSAVPLAHGVGLLYVRVGDLLTPSWRDSVYEQTQPALEGLGE